MMTDLHEKRTGCRPTSLEHFRGSREGCPPELGDEIETWAYNGPGIPPAGGGNARINLWLLDGEPPSDGQEIEVVIEAFGYAAQGG
jgi:hypothetical protein